MLRWDNFFAPQKRKKENGPCPAVRQKNNKKTVSENPRKVWSGKNEKKNGFSIFFDTKVVADLPEKGA